MRNGSNRQPPVQCEHPTVGWWIAWAALLAAPAIGLVWARIGHVVQSYFAPAIIFPLLLGAFAGLTVIGLVRLLRIGHRTTILAAALLAAIVAATGQHYFSYLAQYSWRPAASLAHDFPLTDVAPGFNRYLSRQAEIGRPLPGGYLARGWVAWLTWSIDALLVAAGALIVTLLALRVPYCNRCGQWYRTIRNGKIDLVTAARLATLLDVEPPEHPRSARYRLSMCQTGCGPMRCELSWEHGGSVELVQVWIDDRQRRELAAVLDRLADKSDNTDDD